MEVFSLRHLVITELKERGRDDRDSAGFRNGLSVRNEELMHLIIRFDGA